MSDVLAALLSDASPGDGRVLLAGPHDLELIERLATSADVTVLVQTEDDAALLAKELPSVQVVLETTERYDLVIAADGLERLSGGDWSQRLETLVGLATTDATVIVALENRFSLTGLLDSRIPDEPLDDDPTRPASSAQFIAALVRAGLDSIRTYAAVPAGRAPVGLIDVGTAAAAGPGRLPARLAAQALETATAGEPLLAPIAAGLDDAARAGLLGSILPGWLAVCRAENARAIYTTALTVDLSEHGWSVEVTGSPTPSGSAVVFSPETVVTEIPDAVSVESLLLRLAVAGDVPGFRELAERLGEWLRSRPEGPVPLWDDLVIDGDVVSPGVAGWVAAKPAGKPELLASGWQRFHDRLISAHDGHPWPPWMVGEDLVTTWLAMSGVKATPAILARGRELSTALTPEPAGVPDVRTALADADRAHTEAAELAGHISGLERTLAFRDRQLTTRENVIRALRDELQEAAGQRAKLTADHNSRTYRAARQLRRVRVITQPRRLARGIKRRIRRLRG